MNNRILYWLRICATIFCCLLFFHITDAQKATTAKLRFEHLGTDQGFPQSVMTDIKQDKTGFLWIGTRDGVYRYDGYEFRPFSHPINDKRFFKNQEINSICVRSDSSVWIAAANGLFYFDAARERLVQFNFASNEDKSFADEGVSSLYEDGNKNLWFVTGEGELLCTGANNKRPSIFFKKDDIENVFVDHTGIIWLGTASHGLYRLDPSTKKLRVYQIEAGNVFSISGNNVKQVLEDKSGKLWIATLSGLNCFDRGTEKFTRYKFDKNISGCIGSNLINRVLEDHNGCIWVATNRGGVSRFDPRTGTFSVYKNDPLDGMSIGNNFATCLYEDAGHVLWVGTNGGSLNKVSLNKQTFTVYKNYDPQPRTHYIISLYCAHDGIWIGTLSGGFFCFNPATSKSRRWHWDESDMVKGTFDTQYGFADAPDGTLWIATTMDGLLSLDRNTGLPKVHRSLAVEQGLEKRYGQYTCICIDQSGKIWLGSSDGLKTYDRGTRRVTNCQDSSLSKDYIGSIVQDEKGMLWVGGAANGLSRIDIKRGTVRKYDLHKNDPDSVSDDRVNTMAFDKQGLLWVASDGGGLSVFDRRTERFKTFTTADGLPSNVVKGLLVDDCNNLWISTGNGISKCVFDRTKPGLPARMEAIKYDIGDGPGSNDFSYNACTKSSDGKLYFGSLNGLVVFDPDSIEDNSYRPPVVITQLLLDNKTVDPTADSQFLRRSITTEKQLTISFRQNVIGFTFAALNFDHPERNSYVYKLEGFDKDWVYTNASNRTVTYTNLRPKKYVFRVKASNNDGVWSDKEAMIALIITPPFWQTWWFYCLCAVFVVGVFYTIYRYRVRQVIKLQTIRNNIASDLHDDIGSTLNSISIFSEVAKQQAKENIPALEEIGISSRKIIDSMSDIVWTINPENDSFEKIVQRMRSFAHQVLKAKKIEMVFKADASLNEIALSMPVRKNFYLIFKEATNNIVKYSEATRVSFVINNAGKEVRLEIRDNGNGFHLNGSLNGNGIKNMKRRAEEIKAQLNIVTAVGEGTSIEVILTT